MAVRLLPLDEIEGHLTSLKCVKVKEYGIAALWKTARGVHFTVPREGPDKRCNEYSWRKILEEIAPYL
jgi:hypothetical protein